MRTNSLSFRLIFTSAVVAVVLLVSAAFLLAYLFQQALERNFDARLRAVLDGLLANVELATDGSPVMSGRISDPRFKLTKVYWAQVEGTPTEEALARLRSGVDLGDFTSAPAGARLIEEPDTLWPRDPPIRWRANIPTAWLELTLREGKNRQVRRMTARVGLPTLRLVRAKIGQVSVDGLAPAVWREIDAAALWPRRKRLTGV